MCGFFLGEALEEAKVSVDLFLNNSFEEARAVVQPMWGRGICLNYLTGDTLVSKRKSSSAFLVGNRWHSMVCCICLLFFSRADKSIYHALGYGVFMYLKAVMTFEQVPKKKIHKYCPFECRKSIRLLWILFRKLFCCARQLSISEYYSR